MNNQHKKLGQSLVEVMVALSILIIILTTTITLIVNVVNLALSARNKTEAVGLAQKAISEAKAYIVGSCNVIDQRNVFTNIGYPPEPNAYVTPTGKKVVLEFLSTDSPDISGMSIAADEFDPEKFGVLIATISWTDKNNQPDSFQVKEIVKK